MNAITNAIKGFEILILEQKVVVLASAIILFLVLRDNLGWFRVSFDNFLGLQ